MSKNLYISEKPSVAQEFAKALKEDFKKRDGYMESDASLVTWCVGHLVTMSYPETYDAALKRWNLEPLPFMPKEYRYEVIPSVSKQFSVVKGLLNREDVSCIYVCTDSGREGEYIYRLVDQMAKVPGNKEKKRVWIDSQTEEEILRGIREAKPLTAYDNLASAAYLRAKEDYLMGINFSRVLTLKYGQNITNYLQEKKWSAISVGRVMTCVLGMVVRREREIRDFVKTPFYRVLNTLEASGRTLDGEFRAVEGSKYYNSPLLYKENGFREKGSAEKLIEELIGREPVFTEKQENGKNTYTDTMTEDDKLLAEITAIEKKKENKNPPLLFNLAELQNDCSRLFKISPDETLKITQELYEKKLVTYPRTDARVLSTAVAKEIYKNIGGLRNFAVVRDYAAEVMEKKSYQNIARTRYVNDKQITDHYAIIPTGQGFQALNSLSPTAVKVYEIIARRFLSIFYPPAVYQKISLTTEQRKEKFFFSFRILLEEGYLKVITNSFDKRKEAVTEGNTRNKDEKEEAEEESFDAGFLEVVKNLKKGMLLPVKAMSIKEGETAPPKRYNSGSMILAMENAGQLIEDEELRAQIKGSGIGTSATRAEILNKLVKIDYLALNKKTQIITPSLLGEMIYDVVNSSIKSLLNAELTASWEKGLTMVAQGEITEEEYMGKLEGFVARMTNGVKGLNNQYGLKQYFDNSSAFYKKR
ncbi:DNA topoisomerase [Anaerocolumna xylanovorans]|uniref:DNA topoisomerase n=1 Tax=Anaerocolumna xylanovorans DSM 12503 TaxID=1121345 RepID=A0A1M7YJE0_9FIRM|nr:DNA topoisomerase [Anaerocolumna xylanovorans]SHO52733.1 DNA topoisomerase-3 [Anaerocolumna xylanovorans DSM 12503]